MPVYPTYPLSAYNAPYWPPSYQMPQYIPQGAQPQQTPQMPPQAAQPAPASMPNIIWVDDRRTVDEYPIAPNNAVAFWRKDMKAAYIKQADASGRPTVTECDIVERKDSASVAGSHETPVEGYARQKDLAALAGIVNDFNGSISALRQDVDAIKGDVYGLAGKKRAARKAEGAEDE